MRRTRKREKGVFFLDRGSIGERRDEKGSRVNRYRWIMVMSSMRPGKGDVNFKLQIGRFDEEFDDWLGQRRRSRGRKRKIVLTAARSKRDASSFDVLVCLFVCLFAKADRLTWVFIPSQATSSIALQLMIVWWGKIVITILIWWIIFFLTRFYFDRWKSSW